MQWLANSFPDGIIYSEGTTQIGYDTSDPSGLFSTITSTPPTYTELSGLICAKNGNWQFIFDQWKIKGIVS